MTPEEFIYWLSGFIELGQLNEINAEQIEIIKNHISITLNRVADDKKVTPFMNTGGPYWSAPLTSWSLSGSVPYTSTSYNLGGIATT